MNFSGSQPVDPSWPQLALVDSIWFQLLGGVAGISLVLTQLALVGPSCLVVWQEYLWFPPSLPQLALVDSSWSQEFLWFPPSWP